ncbi:MAG: hypothetical protein A2904_02130 [Candidatus Staskawiczbacteria bacterium RIFCSPLOWO2_01_FULL_33_9]|uniref:Peptidoglycan binding-like domain-containing protein n=1 Tax=Candidatus Staskawiczbacteria bacterium RIFCSPLOWO2_01_FULL_33_9 TaxID=1802211 RepID=A0A1G2IAA7_9BACT|nr:MAG: hypothetical protein A2904_02130 [Candidatus Staskawiczbacteria bacterium RIFCSPLOWO2_01_FULL_33_9]
MKKALVIVIFCMLFMAPMVQAVSFGDIASFNVDKNFDSLTRSEVTAVLVKTTPKLYFYIEKNWWDSNSQVKQIDVLNNLEVLSQEFENKIYPTLTSIFGSEWKPGVDGDEKITILFQSLREGAGGYFRESDGYLKLQITDSNEREMIYLPISQIENSQVKVFLAHEFVHLITFNQKNRIFDVAEEVWLNEARADYSANILGYDDQYQGSNLQRRVQAFLEKPSDSLTEWQETKYDYGTVNLFTYYLIDHYGINILIDSLKSKLVGIESINYALQKNSIEENFAEIFTNWTIAMAINDCSLDLKYCYLNKNLKNLRLNPTLNFLPLAGDSSLSVTNVTKNWAGNWQKIIGGNGDLKLNFSSLAGLDFKVAYIVYDKNNNYSLNFLELDENESGEINIINFGNDQKSLIIIPSLQTKTSGFNGLEFTYPFTFTISIKGAVSPDEQATIQKLLEQIDYLKKEIAKVLGQGNSICQRLNNNLYFGVNNNSEVKCLQEFLKLQGPSVYPEGFVTGNFGNLTKLAVVRFQEKYKSEILNPIGLQKGTGFVGSLTRAKINQIIP